jgi:hypothetical protein
LKEFNKKQKLASIEADFVSLHDDDTKYLLNVELVGKLMGELKDECRDILIEYYYNNRSMAELKDIFNVNSIQAVKNKKYRCLGYLVKIFKNKGINFPHLMENE